MTTLLPKEQLDMLRSIGDAANVLLALIMIDRRHPSHSTTVQELKYVLGKDKRTIENRLHSLCGANRAVFDGRGYVLLEGGRAWLLGAAPSLPNPLSKLENGSLDWDVIEALALSPDDEQAPIEDQAPEFEDAQIVHEGEETPTRAMRVLLEEEDIKSESLIQDSSSIDSRSAQNVQTSGQTSPNGKSQPTTLQILDATELLFEKTMTTKGLENKSKRLAIGWVAQAWDQRKHLRSPQGLIYSRLSADPVQMPQTKYYDHPCTFLPESYLVAIGMIAPRPAEDPVIVDDQGEEYTPAPIIPDASVRTPINGSINAERAWESVLGQLQMEMPRASFETWVSDTKAVRFDGNTLAIGTHNAYAREWLESRLASTVSRLLVGILAQSVKVVFVVSSGDDR